jgi:MarR family transcriptional regulator, organic hydroperoxide resistance regulator
MTGEPKVTRAIERANQLVRRYLAARLERLDITEVEAHIMARMSARGPCSVADLRTAFGFRASTLTNALDRLEGKALLARRTDPSDRRTFLLELTASGRRVSRRVIALVDDLEGRVSSRVSRDQVAGFQAVVAALEEALR